MKRRAVLQLFTAGFCANALSGCLQDLRFWDDKPRTPKVPLSHVENSRRVDELTKRIVEQNTFTGLEPIVTVLGVPEASLFHRGDKQLFISDGLVKKCKTDAELAAVLCSELGQMMAQQRTGKALARDRESKASTAIVDSVNPKDVVQAEEELKERQAKAKLLHDTSDAVQLARRLLEGAGFDPAELDRVEPMLQHTDRGDSLKKQMAGNAPPPTWNK
ncbi:MAG TPA: hypothetical protein VGL71_02670 [Urbifossiella sp.]|jgi:predicted Zn-dependent protease